MRDSKDLNHVGDSIDGSRDKARAAKLISHAVETTRPRWKQFDRTWDDIDRIFIHHGYEQQGFEIFKFLPLLDKRDCYTIDALGSLPREEDGSKYDREYSGSLTAPFYVALRCGERGEKGKSLYDAITEFQSPGFGRAGQSFWQLIWWLLMSCRYLKTNHSASFRCYILGAFSKFIGKPSITDDDFLSTTAETWSSFVERTRPWEPLMGVGPNTFAFIFGDIVEARFAPESYKLDDENRRFFRVTGIADLVGNVERKSVIRFLRDLETDYTLREINKGIYTYCSVTEREQFGYCRSLADCKRCAVNPICGKRIQKQPAAGGSHSQGCRSKSDGGTNVSEPTLVFENVQVSNTHATRRAL